MYMWKLVSILMLLPFVTTVQAEEVTVPAVDGMIIDTQDNLLQQVNIRLKAFGPGVCAVRVSFADKEVGFLAPPLVWSDWFVIGPAVSGGTYKLGFSVDCDTGAIGEVRYEK